VSKLYVDLVLRLRADAALAVNAYARAAYPGQPGVTPKQITTLADATILTPWRSALTKPGPLCGYAGDRCASEVEALCSLIERAEEDAEAAGGFWTLHLLAELDHQQAALEAYRRVTNAVVATLLSTPISEESAARAVAWLDMLDEAAEVSDLVDEIARLRAIAAGRPR